MLSILKFGGSTLEVPSRLRQVTAVVSARLEAGEEVVVVVSAFAGVTRTLVRASERAAMADDTYLPLLEEVRRRHLSVVDTSDEATKETVGQLCDDLERVLSGVRLVREASLKTLDCVLGFGVRLSAIIITALLRQKWPDCRYLDARDVVITDDSYGHAKVDLEVTYENIRRCLAAGDAIPVVTGHLGATERGETTTLGRGGADYTAALLAAALGADRIVIWSHEDGMMTANPDLVEKAFPIAHLTYEEAMELSHFGAKVYFPPTMHPATTARIPLHIKNIDRPDATGTVIGVDETEPLTKAPVRGISSVGDVALLRLQGMGMIGVAGVARRLFGALSNEDINVILISQASSEHSICAAVAPEHASFAKAVVEREFALEIHVDLIDDVSVEPNLSIIAIVGKDMRHTPNIAGRLFGALGRNGINVVAIAQGSSELNISVVIGGEDEAKALNVVHDAFFLSEAKTVNLFVTGTGPVGHALLQQVEERAPDLLREHHLDIRLIALADGERMLFQRDGIAPATWRKSLETKGRNEEPRAFIEAMKDYNLPNTILVDCTGGEGYGPFYETTLESSISIVTSNIAASCKSYDYYCKLKETAVHRSVRYLYEPDVGAGLPVIGTIRELLRSGDQIIAIEGVFSDSGADMARKLLIIAREMGLTLDEGDVDIQTVAPEEGLRPVATIRDGTARVGFPTFDPHHALYPDFGDDSVICYYTERYRERPLVIRGPGASVEVTAARLFADIIRATHHLS